MFAKKENNNSEKLLKLLILGLYAHGDVKNHATIPTHSWKTLIGGDDFPKILYGICHCYNAPRILFYWL